MDSLRKHNASYQNNISALGQVLFQIALASLPVVVFFLLFPTISLLNFIFFVFVCVFVATRMRALGNIMHECVHNSYAPTKRGNIFFGNFIAILLFSSFYKYKKSHFMHHRYLDDKEKDEDYKFFLKLIKPSKESFFLIIFNPVNWFYSWWADFYFFEKNRFMVLLKIIYALILFCFLKHKIGLTLLIVYLTTYQMMKIFSNLYDHHKNFQVKNKIFQLVFFPRNDIYHLVHHQFPRVPVAHLSEIYNNISIYKGKNV